jgi:hypothetical protein
MIVIHPPISVNTIQIKAIILSMIIFLALIAARLITFTGFIGSYSNRGIMSI